MTTLPLLIVTSLGASAGVERPVSVSVAHEEAAAAIESGRAFVRQLMSSFDAPGCSVAVTLDGQLVWAEARGFADLEESVPLLPSTPMRIHSVSKPLTAAALGVLAQRGDLDLDAPIRSRLPEFPQDDARITLRSLGGHLAGIRHYRDDAEVLNTTHYGSARETLEIFAADPLVHEPGTGFSYSSFGWNVIGAAIESVEGVPFPECIERLVLTPLDLRHTGCESDGSERPCVRYYERQGGELEALPPLDLSDRWPSGGMVSTPTDLVSFASAFFAGGLVSEGTLRELTSAQRTSGGEPVPYGLGWSIGRSPTGGRALFHKGGSSGGMSFLAVLPDDGFAFAAILNVNGDFGEAEPPGREAILALMAFLECRRDSGDEESASAPPEKAGGGR